MPHLKNFLQRFRLRHKLAALSLVGVLMCVLPLLQVLNYQGLEISLARNAQAELDPLLGAVALQRGLLAHRDSAGQVLRGRTELDTERLARQAAVDSRLTLLDGMLGLRGGLKAIGEAQAMSEDWARLVSQIAERSISADNSDAAHRLLVEQTLQVIDLVAQGSNLLHDKDADVATLAASLARPLPQLSTTLALLQSPRPKGDSAAAAAEAQLETAMLPLGEKRPLGRSRDRSLADAVAAARVATHSHLRLLRDPKAVPEETALTSAKAVQLNDAVIEATQATLRHQLAARVQGVESRRAQLLGTLAALGAVAAALLFSLLRATRSSPRGSTPVPEAAEREQAYLRNTIVNLMKRLRQAKPKPKPKNQAVRKPPKPAPAPADPTQRY
jgi:hypothetical protein